MDKKQIKEIDVLTRAVHDGWNKIVTGGKDLETTIALIQQFNKKYLELQDVMKNVKLTNEELLQLYIVKEYDKTPMKINSVKDLKQTLADHLEAVESICCDERVLNAIMDKDGELFHQIIQKHPDAAINLFNKMNSGRFDNLCKYDSLVSVIWDQNLTVEAFNKGHKKLKELDDAIFANDYFFEQIKNIVAERLYNHFKEKLDSIQQAEQKQKIKLMLDKKIEETVKEIVQRRELYLSQEIEQVKELVSKYEV